MNVPNSGPSFTVSGSVATGCQPMVISPATRPSLVSRLYSEMPSTILSVVSPALITLTGPIPARVDCVTLMV